MNPQSSLFELVVNYETSKREGKKTYLKEADYNQLIDYFEYELLYEEALEVTEEAIQMFPYTIAFLFRKIHLFIFNGNLNQALIYLDKAEKIMTEKMDIKLHRAWIFAELNVFTKSFEIIEELKSTVEDSSDLSLVYYYEALIKDHQGNFDSAFKALQKAINLDPQNEEALEKFWWIASKLGNQDKNIKFFEKVVETVPLSWWGWFNLGTSLEFNCRYEEALEAYEYAMALDDKKEISYRFAAEIYFNLKNYQKALRCYENILRLFNPDSDIYLNIAICYLNLGKIAAAKEFLVMAKEEDEFNEDVFYYYAECCRNEGRFKNAITYYKKAISLSPLKEEYFRGLAETYGQLGNVENAKIYFQRMADIGPDTLENFQVYIEFLYSIGQIRQAINIIDEAFVFHDDIILKYYKIAYQVALGQESEAIYYLEEVLQEDFGSHFFLFDAHPEIVKNEKVMNYLNDFEKKRFSYT